MGDCIKILLLGGTSEARRLAARLSGDHRYCVKTSLAGVTQNPLPVAGNSRRGGFGGLAGLIRYLRSEAIDLVIDGTHSFARTISHNAAEACILTQTKSLHLKRPPWQAVNGDRWVDVADIHQAADEVNGIGQRVFLTIGRQDIAAFTKCFSAWFLIRSIDRPKQKPDLNRYELMQARGPFTLNDELTLLQKYKIDLLVSKNSGGSYTYAKIKAARLLGLPVVMSQRPVSPPGNSVGSVEAALTWLEASYS